MEPEKLGRAFGIGVRVASKVMRDRAAKIAEQDAKRPAGAPLRSSGDPQTAAASVASRAAGRTLAFGEGTKKFGQAFFGRLRHASSVLWLEISGLFFAFFTLFFAQSIYRVHGAWRRGAEHTHFLLYVVLAVVFAWFCVSSFLRAHKKQKKAH